MPHMEHSLGAWFFSCVCVWINVLRKGKLVQPNIPHQPNWLDPLPHSRTALVRIPVRQLEMPKNFYGYRHVGSPCHPHNRATTCTTFFFLPVSTTPHLSFSPSRPAPPPPSPDDPSLRCRCAAAANSGKYVRSPLFFPSPTASPYGGGSEPIGCCRPELVGSLDVMSDLDS